MTERTLLATMLTERYEELRSFALGEPTQVIPKGLALFLRQGMPGWIGAWSHLLPAKVSSPAGDSSGRAVSCLETEVALVLVDMALSASRRLNQ